MYTCDKHNIEIEKGVFCIPCAEAFKNRRDHNDMTGEERAAEIKWWGVILTIPFGDLHQRFEELTGVPIFTHQFADKDIIEKMMQWAREAKKVL